MHLTSLDVLFFMEAAKTHFLILSSQQCYVIATAFVPLCGKRHTDSGLVTDLCPVTTEWKNWDLELQLILGFLILSTKPLSTLLCH